MSRIGERIAPARMGPSFRWLLGSSWVANLGDGVTLALAWRQLPHIAHAGASDGGPVTTT